jgi:hypothetical protein
VHQNDCSVSTTWDWRPVKISQRPKGPGNGPPQASSLRRLTPWPRRHRISLTIVSRGGSESWYEIRTRGVVLRVPGHRALEDVMATIYNDV